jgi:hypothetical protein
MTTISNANIDKVINLYYSFWPQGGNYYDATHGLNIEYLENEAIKKFLLEEEILSQWNTDQYVITKKGQDIIQKFNGKIEEYLRDKDKIQEEYLKLEQARNVKLYYDLKHSKWQARTFWWVFIFGLIGGICGIISLVMQINEKANKPESKIENTRILPLHKK